MCFWIAVEDGTLMLKKRWKSMPGLRNREIHCHCGAAARLTVHGDMAADLSHESVDLTQSETRSPSPSAWW